VSDKRLLIIDDEPEVGAIIRQIAEGCGFEVEATTSADAFKAAYSTFRPTVIIVDLAVPNTDGIQLFRWLADEHCTVPIVIVSGFDDKVLESAKRLGEARGLLMGGIITKPMRAADICSLLNGLAGTA
jgi:DNA-binding response OmpR family regulator